MAIAAARAAAAALRASIESPAPWTLSHCADFFFEVSVEMGGKGVKKMMLAVCPKTRELRYTLDEKGEGLVTVAYSRINAIEKGVADTVLVMRVGGTTSASAALMSAYEHRLENERDRDALMRFLQAQVSGDAGACMDFGGLRVPQPILHGDGKKKGSLTWSSRYLVLQHGRLLIWRSFAAFVAHHTAPLNVLSLSYITVVRSQSDSTVLQVKKAERDYQLQLPAADREQWALAIEACSAAYIECGIAAAAASASTPLPRPSVATNKSTAAARLPGIASSQKIAHVVNPTAALMAQQTNAASAAKPKSATSSASASAVSSPAASSRAVAAPPRGDTPPPPAPQDDFEPPPPAPPSPHHGSMASSSSIAPPPPPEDDDDIGPPPPPAEGDSLPAPPPPLPPGETYSDSDDDDDTAPAAAMPAEQMVGLNIHVDHALGGDLSPLGVVFIPLTGSLDDVRKMIGSELDDVPDEYVFLFHEVPVGRRQEPKLNAANMGPHIVIRATGPAVAAAQAAAKIAAEVAAREAAVRAEEERRAAAAKAEADARAAAEAAAAEQARAEAEAIAAAQAQAAAEAAEAQAAADAAAAAAAAVPKPEEMSDLARAYAEAEAAQAAQAEADALAAAQAEANAAAAAEAAASAPPPAPAEEEYPQPAAPPAEEEAPSTFSLTFFLRSGPPGSEVDEPCGMVDLAGDIGSAPLSALRDVMDQELDELPEFVFLQGAVPVSRKQESKKSCAAVVTHEGYVYIKLAGTKGAVGGGVGASASTSSAEEPVPSAPEAPPMTVPSAPPPPPAPGAPSFVTPWASPKSGAPAGGPSNALLDAIRAGPKLRKAPSGGGGGSGSGGGGGSGGGSSSSASGGGRGPVRGGSGAPDLMSQLSAALAGRRRDLQPAMGPGGSEGGSKPAMRFGAPKAAAAPPKEVVWD